VANGIAKIKAIGDELEEIALDVNKRQLCIWGGRFDLVLACGLRIRCKPDEESILKVAAKYKKGVPPKGPATGAPTLRGEFTRLKCEGPWDWWKI
jgi:hypothetical protein